MLRPELPRALVKIAEAPRAISPPLRRYPASMPLGAQVRPGRSAARLVFREAYVRRTTN